MTKQKRVVSKTRRANNEGSIYQRNDGRWAGVATVGYDDEGRQKRKVVYGKTRLEVNKKLSELTNRIANDNLDFVTNNSLEDMMKLDGTPHCPKCGGLIKPDVVLYEEGLDQDVLQASIEAISRADLLIIAGTSLRVYPAAGLVNYFRGKHIVVINKEPLSLSDTVSLEINEPVGEVFSQLHI